MIVLFNNRLGFLLFFIITRKSMLRMKVCPMQVIEEGRQGRGNLGTYTRYKQLAFGTHQ